MSVADFAFVSASAAYFVTAFVYSRAAELTTDVMGRVLFGARTFLAFALAVVAHQAGAAGAWLWVCYAVITAFWRLRGIRTNAAAGRPMRGVARMFAKS